MSGWRSFPFAIAKLSRFCSTKEQRETIQQLAAGTVDIVIGTHRLASHDVRFHNLGLLIIDEEQRFGVEVKERLKTIRSTVDVLTLSATPIPRTLHMALTGIRDISNLETPPEDRIAVETRVTRWSHELIRHAILRELNRGGQVFFVHNRVNDIETVAQRLKYIVPEASIAIGHGQMPEDELEQVMVDFVDQRFDILLATTIVESGLDIPNANTIFIDEADRYGLADLHQLRGRVGRYKHRALLLSAGRPGQSGDPQRGPTTAGDRGVQRHGSRILHRHARPGNPRRRKRAGNPAERSHCPGRLRAVLPAAGGRRAANQTSAPETHARTSILNCPARPTYRAAMCPTCAAKSISTADWPAAWARRRSNSCGGNCWTALARLPDCVERLLALAQLKSDAAFWQIDSLHLESPYMVFGYTDAGRARQLLLHQGGRLRRVDDRSLYLTLPLDLQDPDQIIATAKSVLQTS